MPWKSPSRREQARIAVKDGAARKGGRLGTGSYFARSVDHWIPHCALGVMAHAFDGRESEGNMCEVQGHYGLTSAEWFDLWSVHDSYKGDPQAVLQAIDSIPVEGE